MLQDRTKTTIRQIFRRIVDTEPGFQTRAGQNRFVAEVAKTLAGEYHNSQRILVAEAGTGTGKSLGYLLGAIPYALSQGKKVVIATATVALQEQLIAKDLPFFKRHAELNFEFELIKGRQRYLCQSKLYALLEAEALPVNLSFLPATALNDGQKQQLDKLAEAFRTRMWSGDRDSFPEPVDDALWQLIASDKHSCRRQHQAHQRCPFHLARQQIDRCDVLVANHAVLLADLELGGGVLLPEPDACIYIIDEAHHLPHTCREFASAHATVNGAMDWLEKLVRMSRKIPEWLKTDSSVKSQLKIADLAQDCLSELRLVRRYFEQNALTFTDDGVHRFGHGELPKALQQVAEPLANAAEKALRELDRTLDGLNEAVSDGKLKKQSADTAIAEASFFISKLEHLQKLWSNFSLPAKSIPHARWIEQLRDGKTDWLLNDSPIQMGFYLKDQLWQRCAGAVLCSATLSVLNSFDHFAFEAGLNGEPGVKYLTVASPFAFDRALLSIPKMALEPTDDGFTELLCQELPKYLPEKQASLVLFSSYWQMQQVAVALRSKGFSLLMQGEASRQSLLELHKLKCDNQQTAILFGSQSFAEGLDLPGHLLTNLVITKLPFAVPTSPVEQAHAEYIEQRGGNPFLQLTVPTATKKLVQSCGRLLRKEQDQGTITILDRRLVSKRYGKAMLDTLPPYQRKIEY